MYTFHVLSIPLFGAYGALLYANYGDNVTLPCFYASGAKYLCWYRQVAGEQPQIISSFYKHSPQSNCFHNQFKDNNRFSVYAGAGFYHLNISSVQDSDSAMYYCGQTSITVTEFNNGTFLLLKESCCRSFLQQPASDSVQPGGSVTLNCTVHAGTSDSGHSVYWVKKDTGKSHLGMMHIHTHSSSECVESSEFGSPAQSCVYSLSKRKVRLSDAGIYYCAVASCGQILLGKGTRLDVGGEPFVLRHGMVVALSASVIVNMIFICVLCKMGRRTYLQSEGPYPKQNAAETADSQNEGSDNLQYVTLDIKKKQTKIGRQRSREETIYSGIKLSDLQ